MSKRLAKNIDYLRVLCKSNKRQRDGILKGADKELVYTICECIDNCLNGNVKLTGNQVAKLKRKKAVLRRLRDKKVSVTQKKKLLVQHGGFLSALLAPVIGIAGSLIGDAIGGLIRKRK